MWPFAKKKQPARNSTQRIFYSSDIHGSERCWLKFLNAAKFYDAQALIMGGDLTGKVLVPLVAQPQGYQADFLGQTLIARDDAELAELEKNIRFNGFYPYRCTQADYTRLSQDSAFFEHTFQEAMLETLRRWLNLAEERLAGTGIHCFVIPGNDDDLAIDALLAESSVLHNPDHRILEWGVYQILGESWVPPTPWQSPREMSEEQLEAQLDACAAGLDRQRPTIFVLHSPPYRSTLDDAPQLRDDLTVVTMGGQVVMVPVGSSAVRRVIERYQPMLALHGHIHEARGSVQIGSTLCMNPGSAYGEGVLHGALITLEGQQLLSSQLVSG